ncbi:MAG: hypothetical protein NVS4B8_14850 [Herpetosiphon sp.]
MILIAVAFVFGLSRGLWLPLIGYFLAVSDPLQPVDAVVPLAGDRDRVTSAVQLFDQGFARWFVLTDMVATTLPSDTTYVQVMRKEIVKRGIPSDRIAAAPNIAASTFREALNVRQLAQQQKWHSLLVVTSPYHTRRTRLMFQHIFHGTGILVIVRPSEDSFYQPSVWWKSYNGRHATEQEYSKLLLYLLGYHTFFSK